MKTKQNDPAFPTVDSSCGERADYPVHEVWSEGGLTKREFFAAVILSGLKTNDHAPAKGTYATWAVTQADALIAALNE